MKKKFAVGFLILIALLLVAEMFYNSVWVLCNRNAVENITVDMAVEIAEVKHSLNLIPVGKDYFYLGYNETTDDYYLIKASKNWGTEHFDEDAFARDEAGYQMKATVRKVWSSNVSSGIRSRLRIGGLTEQDLYPKGTDYCLNAQYKRLAVLKLIEFISLLVLCCTGFSILHNNAEVGKCLRITSLTSLFVFLILLVYTLIRYGLF